jgi:hypothetical protein
LRFRHQFFLHARLELLENRLRIPDCDTTARVIALLAQAESADDDIPSSLVCLCTGAPSDLLQRVEAERSKIRVSEKFILYTNTTIKNRQCLLVLISY